MMTRKGKHYRWAVFGLLAAGYLLVYFHRLCPAVVALDLMRDLGAGGGLMGLLASAYFYPYALMQIPSGLLSDSWGPRKTVTSFFVLAGLASLAFGLAPGPGWAIGARVLVGLGVAMFFVPVMKILTRWFTPKEFAFMTGLLMAVGGLGALGAAAPLAWMSELLGWRGSFLAIGGLTLAIAAGIWLVVRNDPGELGLPASAGPEAEGPRIPLRQALRRVPRTRGFRPLAAWFFCTFGVFFSFGGLWGGPWLMHVHGMDKAGAGNVLSMLAVSMIVGSPLYSVLSDRVLRSRKRALVLSAAGMVLLMAWAAFLPGSLSPAMLYVWFLGLGLVGSAVVVVGFAMAKELYPVAMAGTAVGLINLFPFLAGAVYQPVVGLVLESFPLTAAGGYPPEAYARVFMLYLASSLAALLAACLTTETFSA